MSSQLIKETLTYRVDTEDQAIAMIEDVKSKQSQEGYFVKESKYQLKQKKLKGEIVDEYFFVTLTKIYE